MNVSVVNQTATGGIVYHDGGTVKSVAFTPDKDLDGFEQMIVSVEDARLIQDDTRKWTISKQNGVIQLVRQTDLILTMENAFTRLTHDETHALRLNIRRYPDRLIFDMPQAFRTSVESLPFIVTKKHDPSVVFHAFEVSVRDLVLDGCVSVPLPATPPIDLYTKRLFPAYHVRTMAVSDDIVLLLPKHFVDLAKFTTIPIAKPHLRASLDRAGRALTLSLIGDAMEVYKRPVDRLRLLFTLPDDATLVLHGDEVPIDALRAGYRLKIPDIVVQRTFDLWAPLLYRHMYMEL